MHTVKVQHHLAHVPDYLLPAALRNEESVEDEQDGAAAPAPAPQKKRKQPGQYGSAKRHKYQVRYTINIFARNNIQIALTSTLLEVKLWSPFLGRSKKEGLYACSSVPTSLPNYL